MLKSKIKKNKKTRRMPWHLLYAELKEWEPDTFDQMCQRTVQNYVYKEGFNKWSVSYKTKLE
jgi:hypothetical protein